MPDADIVRDATVYRVAGMDCSSCATKIEKAVKAIPGVEAVNVSITTGLMRLDARDPARTLPRVETAVRDLGYGVSRIRGDEDGAPELSHTTAAYRKALWLVVGLNLGYGAVEVVAGFVARSQALKADALDFVGDGAISLLGLLAISWGLGARAKAALLQGVFLGLLGLYVMGSTFYRVFVANTPEAELMGVFGFVALVVNLGCAAALIPHRNGDANVRAVWLFSRNDALGNLAVVAAAGLVAWTRTPWPDLIVALIIAGLFLQSARLIVRDARRELALSQA